MFSHAKCQKIIRPWPTPALSPGTDNDVDRPSGTGVSLHRYPGTSCLATISLSLRDKSHSPIERLALRGGRYLEALARLGYGFIQRSCACQTILICAFSLVTSESEGTLSIK